MTKIQAGFTGLVVVSFLIGVGVGYSQGIQNVPVPPQTVEQQPPPELLVPALSEKEISPKGGYQLPTADLDATVDEAAEAQILSLTNIARHEAGVAELKGSDRLVTLARAYDQEMLSSRNFSHTDKNGKNPFDRMDMTGIKFRAAGENIGLGSSIDQVFGALMRSPGHKENIMSPDFTEIGVGVRFSKQYGYVVDQEFIKPQ